jgi:hypothetical protein
MEAVHQSRRGSAVAADVLFPDVRPLLDEERFRNLLVLERERAELCKRHMLLVQIDVSGLIAYEFHEDTMRLILSGLFSTTWGNDLKGWFDGNRMIGIIFPNLDKATIETVFTKVKNAVEDILSDGCYPAVTVSRIVFPVGGNISPTVSQASASLISR